MHKLVASAGTDHPNTGNFDLLGDTDYKVRITKGVDGYVSGVAYATINVTYNKLFVAGNGVDPRKKRKNQCDRVLALPAIHAF